MLAAGATSIFHDRAPQTARTPLIIIAKITGAPVFFAVGGEHSDEEFFDVRAITFERFVDKAETIAARIDTVLHDAPLSVTGRTLLKAWRTEDIQFLESIGKDRFHHVGASYQIITQA